MHVQRLPAMMAILIGRADNEFTVGMVSFKMHVHPISMNRHIDPFRAERCYLLTPAVSLVNIPRGGGQHFNRFLFENALLHMCPL